MASSGQVTVSQSLLIKTWSQVSQPLVSDAEVSLSDESVLLSLSRDAAAAPTLSLSSNDLPPAAAWWRACNLSSATRHAHRHTLVIAAYAHQLTISVPIPTHSHDKNLFPFPFFPDTTIPNSHSHYHHEIFRKSKAQKCIIRHIQNTKTYINRSHRHYVTFLFLIII